MVTVERLRASATRVGATLGGVGIALSVLALIVGVVVLVTVTFPLFDGLGGFED